jgi:hypothetical protein
MALTGLLLPLPPLVLWLVEGRASWWNALSALVVLVPVAARIAFRGNQAPRS